MRKSFILLILPLLFACASNKIKLTQVGKFQSSVRAEQLVDHPEPRRSEKETTNSTGPNEEVFSQRSSEYENHLNGQDQTSIEHKLPKGFGVQTEEQKSILNEETAEQSFSTKQNKGSAKVYKNELLFALGGIMAFFMFLGLRINPDRAKRISYWAKENPKKTWMMIGGIKMIVGAGGLYIGKMLYENNIAFSDSSTYALLGIFGAAAIAYPLKSAKRNFIKHSYLKQKMIDGLLALLGLLLMVNLGNQAVADDNFVPVVSTVFDQTDQILYGDEASIELGTFDQSKERYYSEETALDEGAEDEKEEANVWAQIGLTLLAVAIFLMLLYLVAVASCNLSCSGQEALATVVLIGGLIACILLLIFALNAIWKKM
ncbi:MAG: hypothetical protein EP305_05570 [Bacteroidetes bacterium]|nr:MAG: hypothetical protein EP305_05570 [Bacteroidota bacterium]